MLLSYLANHFLTPIIQRLKRVQDAKKMILYSYESIYTNLIIFFWVLLEEVEQKSCEVL